MLKIKELIAKAKESMTSEAYEDFVTNTIKTCGYNSDTFELYKNLEGKINVTKYKNNLVQDLKQCAKENLQEKETCDKIEFKDNKKDLKDSLNGIIQDEEIDTILFDNNVNMVDDFMDYNRINGNYAVDKIDMYLESFKSGVNAIDNEPDYSYVKEDIYEDAGLSSIGLENLEMDTSLDNEFGYDQLEDENSLDIDLQR